MTTASANSRFRTVRGRSGRWSGPLDDGKHEADTTETSYESAEKVRGMVLNAVDDDAIGRKEYTDREHETREEEQRRGNESF